MATTLVYIILYFGLMQGTKSIGVVAWISLPIQVLNMLFLVLAGITLTFCNIGIRKYLFGEDVDVEG